MRKVSTNFLREALRELVEVWEERNLTDVVITKDKVHGYVKGEMVYSGDFGEEDLLDLVEQTIPVKMEKDWGQTLSTGSLLRYSFLIKGRCIVRAILWNEGAMLRMIPIDPRTIVGEETLSKVHKKRFFIIERGGQCSGKTTRIIAMVKEYCQLHKGAVIFTYEDPREIYVEEEDDHIVPIAKREIDTNMFMDMVISSPASVCVFQHADNYDIRKLKMVYDCGINVIVELRDRGNSSRR